MQTILMFKLVFIGAADGGGGLSRWGAHFIEIHWYSLIFTDVRWYWLIFSPILIHIHIFIDIGDFLHIYYQGPVVVVVCGGNLVSTSLVRPDGEIWKAGLWLLSRWRGGGQIWLFESHWGRDCGAVSLSILPNVSISYHRTSFGVLPIVPVWCDTVEQSTFME